LGLGAILAVLLISFIAVNRLGVGAMRGGIDSSVSAKINDLVRAWEGTSSLVTVTGGGDRYTLRSGRIALMLRHSQSGISDEEVGRLQQEILDKAKKELGEPPEVVAIALGTASRGARLVVYGFTINPNWVPTSYAIGAELSTSNREMNTIFKEAVEWFKQQMTTQYGGTP